jgi:hypothetical protein
MIAPFLAPTESKRDSPFHGEERCCGALLDSPPQSDDPRPPRFSFPFFLLVAEIRERRRVYASGAQSQFQMCAKLVPNSPCQLDAAEPA